MAQTMAKKKESSVHFHSDLFLQLSLYWSPNGPSMIGPLVARCRVDAWLAFGNRATVFHRQGFLFTLISGHGPIKIL